LQRPVIKPSHEIFQFQRPVIMPYPEIFHLQRPVIMPCPEIFQYNGLSLCPILRYFSPVHNRMSDRLYFCEILKQKYCVVCFCS
jgi:hypothetical protein